MEHIINTNEQSHAILMIHLPVNYLFDKSLKNGWLLKRSKCVLYIGANSLNIKRMQFRCESLGKRLSHKLPHSLNLIITNETIYIQICLLLFNEQRPMRVEKFQIKLYNK